ncbi:VENN motif pre-toxin domain-containing protein [Oligella urethralis]|uniref:VENN motif pre-toxin domain-containing protein n=1 Tax=Oligella urethralis TaxID=90245 RepID=UPI00254DD4BC|nr:VENN motif pre-toxin domain-containing protein [Oligella urethralis]MDK6203687.1 VENN motif pre-toxin domain-containing protein [Oligella urethralis]
MSHSGDYGHTCLGGSIGYGQVSDSQGSTTYSGINTKNIIITDAAKQTLLAGLSAEAMANRVFTATTTENAEALSGALENRFDAVALQKELDTQREVSQAFSQNVQSAKAELNRAADRLTADYEAGRISQAEYDAKRQQLDNGALLLSTIAAGLSAPTNSALGIATATLSPSVAKEIGQYFKSTNKEGSTEHLIAHGLLAAAVAATGGNNALSAAGAAISAEAAAPVLAHYLYGKEANELNADEKATIFSITSLVGAGVGATTGADANLAQGAQSAGTAVDNNWMSDYRGIFGVNQWGPGAASLVDAKLKENPDITPEELQSELKDYMTGAGYESGVSDGIVVWMVAPSAGFGAGAITMIPSLGTGLKVYSLAALKSVSSGARDSVVLNEDYKVSNLAYDLSIGVVIDKFVKKIIESSEVTGVSKRYVDIKGGITNHFLGGGARSL